MRLFKFLLKCSTVFAALRTPQSSWMKTLVNGEARGFTEHGTYLPLCHVGPSSHPNPPKLSPAEGYCYYPQSSLQVTLFLSFIHHASNLSLLGPVLTHIRILAFLLLAINLGQGATPRKNICILSLTTFKCGLNGGTMHFKRNSRHHSRC